MTVPRAGVLSAIGATTAVEATPRAVSGMVVRPAGSRPVTVARAAGTAVDTVPATVRAARSVARVTTDGPRVTPDPVAATRGTGVPAGTHLVAARSSQVSGPRRVDATTALRATEAARRLGGVTTGRATPGRVAGGPVPAIAPAGPAARPERVVRSGVRTAIARRPGVLLGAASATAATDPIGHRVGPLVARAGSTGARAIAVTGRTGMTQARVATGSGRLATTRRGPSVRAVSRRAVMTRASARNVASGRTARRPRTGVLPLRGPAQPRVARGAVDGTRAPARARALVVPPAARREVATV
ncbi:hypothetical protein CGE01nite_02910 [Cellulomonas gelida]|uniref:Uncharacterized protein n=1 Tax=Cellulomonas gelida TaxID=1712 RepID=A0A4Y3KJB4_9CELL|nr:hypothetical protein CGE01nite_02910 [Cellulomonas gelida]